uniref:Macaca fascicularis brain cDNA clone: QflA-19224, similar to human PR domain containing 16 (PRDM16), transcript variant 2, mRNA, RefSeq: NM_199454.1 n=1 Tax=Macaca fascicularis TaxID=9541 RepID=I7GIE1_MACFA|nr:unnamed protein product [Macaca fascicularis]
MGLLLCGPGRPFMRGTQDVTDSNPEERAPAPCMGPWGVEQWLGWAWRGLRDYPAGEAFLYKGHACSCPIQTPTGQDLHIPRVQPWKFQGPWCPLPSPLPRERLQSTCLNTYHVF